MAKNKGKLKTGQSAHSIRRAEDLGRDFLDRYVSPIDLERTRAKVFQKAFFESELDEEWSSPLNKVSYLPDGDYGNWKYAKDLLDEPSAQMRKASDEARSLAARYVIDRLKEKKLLGMMDNEAPYLRSAVELLSKPEADIVYPPFLFVANHIREQYPVIYESVVKNVGLRIPDDLKPSTMLVTLAKKVLENSDGVVEMNWGKFASLLTLCGALAVDSVESNYPEGATQIVETFGVLTEQIMGRWIVSEKDGGGWEGFIHLNVYKAVLPPFPRTLVVLLIVLLLLYFVFRLLLLFHVYITFIFLAPTNTLAHSDLWNSFFSKYGFCSVNGDEFYQFSSTSCISSSNNSSCLNPKNPLDYILIILSQSAY